MGSCTTKFQSEYNNIIENSPLLNNKTKSNDKVRNESCKIIILGAASAGKTTILKQMISVYNKNHHWMTKSHKTHCKPYLTINLIKSFKKLCIYDDVLSNKMDINTQIAAKHEQIRQNICTMNERATFDISMCENLTKLLSDKGIQNRLHYRDMFGVHDNFEYLIKNMHLYCKIDYIPSHIDYLNIQQRTTGFNKLSFTLSDKNSFKYYEIYDCGGSRNERKKWMNVIRNTNIILYVVSLSAYNQSLWEQPSYNRLRESIHLYRRVYHMCALRNARFVLCSINMIYLKRKFTNTQ
eukprot:370638_1